MLILGCVAVICIGIVLGTMGAGGSMLAIPVLLYVFALDIETASAYALFLVGVTSLTGAALKHGDQRVSIRTVFLFGMPSAAGAFICRKWILALIPDLIWQSETLRLTKGHTLLALVSLLMMASATTILLKRTPQPRSPHKRDVALLMIAGFGVGSVTALTGVGGGFLIVPALIILARLPFAIAAGTSLFIIASNCLVAFCGDAPHRTIDWYLLLLLTALAVLGLLSGYWWHRKTQFRLPWQQIFAWLIMLVGIALLVKATVLMTEPDFHVRGSLRHATHEPTNQLNKRTAPI